MPNVTVQKTTHLTGHPAFEDLNRRLDDIRQRAFELFEGRGGETGRELEDWFRAEHEVLNAPPTELAETDDAFTVQVALPGFEPKDIDLTVTPEEIVVCATKQQQARKENGSRVLWTEFTSRQVVRRIGLPNPANVEEAQAKLENGILKVTLPKGPATEAEIPPDRKIAVAA